MKTNKWQNLFSAVAILGVTVGCEPAFAQIDGSSTGIGWCSICGRDVVLAGHPCFSQGSSGSSISGGGGGGGGLIGALLEGIGALLTPPPPGQPGVAPVDPIAEFFKAHPARNGAPLQDLAFGRKPEPVGANISSKPRAAGNGFVDGRGREAGKIKLPINPMPKGAKSNQVPAGAPTKYGGGYNSGGAARSAQWHGERAAGSRSEEAAAEEARNVFDRPGSFQGNLRTLHVDGRRPKAADVPESLRSNPKYQALDRKARQLEEKLEPFKKADARVKQVEGALKQIETARNSASGSERKELAVQAATLRQTRDNLAAQAKGADGAREKLEKEWEATRKEQVNMVRMELDVVENEPSGAGAQAAILGRK